MLTFEEKIAIANTFVELARKDVSLGRVNYHYEGSAFDKKTVIYHLHPGGNGYVYAGQLNDYDTDDKGFVSIRDFSEEQLREIIAASIASLTREGESGSVADANAEQVWHNDKKHTLELKYDEEDRMWYVYAGLNLDAAYETYGEAAEYLKEEGFTRG